MFKVSYNTYMTNTERLIKDLELARKFGDGTVHFHVGKFTGNAPIVIKSLRTKGYVVKPNPRGGWVLK